MPADYIRRLHGDVEHEHAAMFESRRRRHDSAFFHVRAIFAHAFVDDLVCCPPITHRRRFCRRRFPKAVVVTSRETTTTRRLKMMTMMTTRPRERLLCDERRWSVVARHLDVGHSRRRRRRRHVDVPSTFERGGQRRAQGGGAYLFSKD